MCTELTLVEDRSSGWRRPGYSRRAMVEKVSRLGREEALERVRARILSAARSRLSPADAEDVTQEALVLLTTKYAHVSAPEELVAIGVKIVSLMRRGLWRKSARRRALGLTPVEAGDSGVDPFDGPSDFPDPERIARDRQRFAMYLEAVSRLDGRCRDILRRQFEGASFVEIAKELGRPDNTVYSWAHRCNQRLKAILAERWAFVSGVAS
jgi:RNA polymerase sigma factor (sigma-70 family)